jgi:hypothetical protein
LSRYAKRRFESICHIDRGQVNHQREDARYKNEDSSRRQETIRKEATQARRMRKKERYQGEEARQRRERGSRT